MFYLADKNKMDRYVLVISICQTENDKTEECECLTKVKQIFDQIVDFTSQEAAKDICLFPVCSLSGCPSVQRWYFAIQACHGMMQFCSSDWEEVGAVHQRGNSEEEKPTTLEICVDSLSLHDGSVQNCDKSALMTELLEEGAEGVHALTDKLPPPGRALSDVLVLGCTEQCPASKNMLPLLGALRHMSCWHSAKITIITEHTTEWQESASYLSAGLVDCFDVTSCINSRELWRGGLVVREKMYVTELRFNGFSLCTPVYKSYYKEDPHSVADQKLHSEVFHYYATSLDLLHLVTLSDLPSFQKSSTYFQLVLSGKSVKSKLFLEQLKPLRGKVGALFSLSCIVTSIAQPPESQISSQRWRESIARKPKSLPIPDIGVKGESANYFLLVQGTDNTEDGVCSVRLLHSDSQINGVATISGLFEQKLLPSSGCIQSDIFSLPCLQGDALLKRERKVTQVQTRVLKEYFRQKEKSSVPLSDLKTILTMAREQYLRMIDAKLPSAFSLTDNLKSRDTVLKTMSYTPSDWPERNVLHNIEKLQKKRQRRRLGLLGSGSSDSLLSPKDCQKTAFLDAKELLKHFTLEGKPTSELYPLPAIRSQNVFQLSPDLSPQRLSEMSFIKAKASHYHGIEFCLDNQQSLDQDQAFIRLQSRLIRYETQTTCSKEPCVLPFVNSPAPSPAMMSELGSVPDGETLQNADVARLKRKSWDTDVVGGYPHKRQSKSESSDSVWSQSNCSSVTHDAIKSLRQRASISQSVFTSTTSSSSSSSDRTSGLLNQSSLDEHKAPKRKTDHRQMDAKNAKESRSQKHNRMLQEVVVKTLKLHGISVEHKCFEASSKRLFDISKFFLKDLKTSRGLYDEMKKAAGSNAKQVIDWVLEKTLKN